MLRPAFVDFCKVLNGAGKTFAIFCGNFKLDQSEDKSSQVTTGNTSSGQKELRQFLTPLYNNLVLKRSSALVDVSEGSDSRNNSLKFGRAAKPMMTNFPGQVEGLDVKLNHN